jgi:hypothetical protein
MTISPTRHALTIAHDHSTRLRPSSLALTLDLSTAAQLGQIAAAWPEHTRVRHRTSGWTGCITPDAMADLPGADIHLGHAHGLLYDATENRRGAIVSVVWDPQYDLSGIPAWMRARTLQLLAAAPGGEHRSVAWDRHREGLGQDGAQPDE